MITLNRMVWEMTPPKRKKKHVHRFVWRLPFKLTFDALSGVIKGTCSCGKVRHEKNS